MARIIIKKGDVFSAVLNDTQKKYFQYVGLDLTQLNSEVTRVFKKSYLIDEQPALEDVIKDEIDFYAHVVVKLGIKLQLWEKAGNIPDVGKVNVLFRASDDYGNPLVKVSDNWRIWKINQSFIKVGKLKGDHQKAEIGVVVTPGDILQRMRRGKYDFVYPEF
jgi:hypothetical protein